METKLKKYNQKRDFNSTDEPDGNAKRSVKNSGKKLLFTVQHHMASRDHYDLRLEYNGVMLSWAVPKGPSFNTKDKRLAVMVEEHPLEYSNFEGTIPKGQYGGGTVMIWDEGHYEEIKDFKTGLKSGILKFNLFGKRLKGGWTLIKLKHDIKDDNNWLFIKENDEFALDKSGIEKFDKSVRTGRTMAQIGQGEGENKEEKTVKTEAKKKTAAKNPFKKTDVMLAKLETEPPKGNEKWLYELKYDGYRILSYVENGGAKLVSRNGSDYTQKFEAAADSLIELTDYKAAVFDGEMVIIDEDGKTDFQKLQNYIKSPKGKNLFYVVFDLLALQGEDLRGEPLIERKAKLKRLLEDAPSNIVYCEHSEGGLEEALSAVCGRGLEGIIGKKADSVYGGGRNGDWIKIKCNNRQEFIICGYTLKGGRKSGVSAIILGYYDKGKLIYAGRCGTGFNAAIQQEMETKFKKLIRNTAPFTEAPKNKGGEKVFWLEPNLAAEIQFAEFTNENVVRHASFKGLREDKSVKQIVKEAPSSKTAASKKTAKKTAEDEVIINGVTISNAKKLMYLEPEITKEEVAMYYLAVADKMLPYIKNRLLSAVCYPKGAGGESFYKKHPDAAWKAKNLKKFALTESSGKSTEYFYISDIDGIIFMAQMNTLEFHVWGSSIKNVECPDVIVFDLDPDEGMDLSKIRQGARDLKSILDGLNLKSYLKTSGGKGYHVLVPQKGKQDFAKIRDFSKGIVEIMVEKWSDKYTSNVRKQNRKGKIFIDWIRNTRGATSVAPYSLRGRKGARVSMPIAWSELDKIAPDGIDMESAIKRINKKDPWQGFFEKPK